MLVTLLPPIVMLAMAIVGLELTPADLRRVLRYPAQVGIGTACQAVCLPLVAAGLVVLVEPDPVVAGGLILTAAAPQAMTSNYFALLGRANVALSITLTVASSVLALVTTPLAASLGFEQLLGRQSAFDLPPGAIVEQVLAGLLLPVAAGMTIRHHAPALVARHRRTIHRVSLVAVLGALSIIVVVESTTIARHLGSIGALTALFTLVAAGLGFGLGRVLGWTRPDTLTVIAGFPARSLTVATLISVNVLGRTDFLAFAALFYVVQAFLLVPVMLFGRAPEPPAA
jgi:BASS family bile acid:Na+ symporter